jgi:uncharacterized FlaG/YvyC family protein
VRAKPKLFVGLLLICFFPPLPAQVQAAPPQQSPPVEQVIQAEKEQAKRRNKQRQESFKRDTGKLLELATQLKDHVDQSYEDVLSMDVVRKAEQTEKLAPGVKEKMKGY